jgi:hypothetical protein
MKLTKVQQKKLLTMAKTVLIHRRNGHLNYEQTAWERLDVYCRQFNLEAGEVIEQAVEFLKRTSIAASMNGIV